MAKFPIRESEIKVLAQNIVTGLTNNAAVYAAPPVTAIALQAALDYFITLALGSETTLNNQERGKDWEYRVIAVNKAGERVPINTVPAVV